MSPFDRTTERYDNDVAFRSIVDMMQSIMLQLHLTPSEVREAAMFACILVERRKMYGSIVITKSELESWLERKEPR